MWITITASLDVVATTEGGRATPILSGYRGVVYFKPLGDCFGCVVRFDDSVPMESIAPGESCVVCLSYLAADDSRETASSRRGQRFELKEGPKVIAKGSVCH